MSGGEPTCACAALQRLLRFPTASLCFKMQDHNCVASYPWLGMGSRNCAWHLRDLGQLAAAIQY